MPEDKAEGARWRSFKGKTAWVTGAGGGLIAGHGRLLAAKSLDMTEVPTIELVGLNDAQKRALRLANNKIALRCDGQAGGKSRISGPKLRGRIGRPRG